MTAIMNFDSYRFRIDYEPALFEDSGVFEIDSEYYIDESIPTPSISAEQKSQIPLFSADHFMERVQENFQVQPIQVPDKLKFTINSHLQLLISQDKPVNDMDLLGFDVLDDNQQRIATMIQGINYPEFYYLEGDEVVQKALFQMRGLTAEEMDNPFMLDIYLNLVEG